MIILPDIVAVCGAIGTGATTLAGQLNVLSAQHIVHRADITRITAANYLNKSFHGLDLIPHALLCEEVRKNLMGNYGPGSKVIFDCCAAGYLPAPALKVSLIAAGSTRLERVCRAKSCLPDEGTAMIHVSDKGQLFCYSEKKVFDIVINTTNLQPNQLLAEFISRFQQLQITSE